MLKLINTFTNCVPTILEWTDQILVKLAYLLNECLNAFIHYAARFAECLFAQLGLVLPEVHEAEFRNSIDKQCQQEERQYFH